MVFKNGVRDIFIMVRMRYFSVTLFDTKCPSLAISWSNLCKLSWKKEGFDEKSTGKKNPFQKHKEIKDNILLEKWLNYGKSFKKKVSDIVI